MDIDVIWGVLHKLEAPPKASAWASMFARPLQDPPLQPPHQNYACTIFVYHFAQPPLQRTLPLLSALLQARYVRSVTLPPPSDTRPGCYKLCPTRACE